MRVGRPPPCVGASMVLGLPRGSARERSSPGPPTCLSRAHTRSKRCRPVRKYPYRRRRQHRHACARLSRLRQLVVEAQTSRLWPRPRTCGGLLAVRTEQEGHVDRWLLAPVVPTVPGAVLYDGVASTQHDLGTVVELE